MPDVWYIFPSGNRTAAAIACAEWRERGYKTAVAVDDAGEVGGADLTLHGAEYSGYYDAIRRLCVAVDANVVVCGGDDILPDKRDAQDIASEFAERFPDLCGVMQPTGDDFGGTAWAAVSPWIGRGWIEKAYGGNGPHWTGYWHLYGDQELQEVATARGLFWQNPNVTQYHAHWTRGHDDNLPRGIRANINARWPQDKRLFEERKANGFPGSEFA